MAVLNCSSTPIQVWHTKYPKGDTDFWNRLGLEKIGTAAPYPIPTPGTKPCEQIPESCTWKIAAHCWRGGQQANLEYYQDTTRLIWTVGVSTLLLRALRTGRRVAGADTQCEISSERGDSGLAPWRALTWSSHVVANRWQAAFRLYSVNMDGDPLGMDISPRKPWLGQP